MLLTSFGPVWVFLDSVRNLLLEWKVKGLRKKIRAVWRLASICLFLMYLGRTKSKDFPEGRDV